MTVSQMRAGLAVTIFLALSGVAGRADNTAGIYAQLKLAKGAAENAENLLCNTPVAFRDMQFGDTLATGNGTAGCDGKTEVIHLPPGTVEVSVFKKKTLTVAGVERPVVVKGDATIQLELPGPVPAAFEVHPTSVVALLGKPGVTVVLARYYLPQPAGQTSRDAVLRPETIRVTVADAKSNDGLAGVSIRLQNTDTGENIPGAVVTPLGAGQYQILLPAGKVALVTFAAPGHDAGTYVLSTLGAGPRLTDADGKPAPGTVQLEQRVAARVPLDIVQTSRRETFSPELISLLPLLLPRNLDHILELAPGVANGPETSALPGPALSPGLGTPGSFSVNGLRSRQNDFTLDGSDLNDEETGSRRQGFSAPYPETIESLTSLYLITASADARYGRSLAGQIDALSRTGGPKLHGQVYGFASGGPFRARNFFDLSPGAYGAGMSLIPVTADGSLAGSQAQFLKDNSYNGPLIQQGGYAYQKNPLETPPADNRYQFGFNLGGAIDQNTHFFVSGQRDVRASRTQANFAVPTMRERGKENNGDTGGGGLYPDTLTGDAIYSLIPLPNNPMGPYGPNTYTQLLPSGSRGYMYSAKLDRSFPLFQRAQGLSLRWNQTRDTTDLPSVGDAIFSSIQPVIGTANLASFLTSNISPRMFNTFRFSIGFTSVRFDPIGTPLPPSSQITSGPDAPFLLNAPLLINASAGSPVYRTGLQYFGDSADAQTEPITGPVGQIQIAGYSAVGLDSYHYPQHRHDQTTQWADTFSFTREKHILYAGFDTRSINLNTYVDRNARPLVEFNGMRNVFSPNQFIPAEALAAQGQPGAVLRTLDTGAAESAIQLEQRQLDFFVQDYYHLRSNLTVNAGLRVELSRLPSGGRTVSGVDAASLAAGVTQANTECTQVGEPASCLALASGLQTALPNDLQQVFNVGLNSRSARAGLAWDPFGDGKTAIRIGSGFYSGVFPFDLIDEARSAFNQFLPLNVKGFPYEGIDGAITGLNALGAGYNNPLTFLATNGFTLLPMKIAHLGDSYSIQNSFSMERQLGSRTTISAAYVGTMGRHLLTVTTPSGGPVASLVDESGTLGSPLPTDYPFPFYLPTLGLSRDGVDRMLYTNGGSSTYHSGQLELVRRQAASFNLRASFTWSHSSDNASDYYDSPGGPALPQSSVTPSERGDSSFDVRYRAAGYAVWTPRFFRGNRYLGGWQWLATGIVQSGLPYTITSADDINGDGNLTDRLNESAPVKLHPDAGNPRIQAITTTLNMNTLFKPYIVNLFGPTIAPQYLDGKVGRNTFRALGLENFDAALVKRFSFSRFGDVEMRVEGFNILNHVNFALPIHMLPAPGFGTSVATVGGSRTFQVGLKKDF